MSFSFGTPSSAPATTSLAGGFNFGANKPATTPGFGLATSQPSTGLFGTPATSAPAFGTATPSFGASFGATSTAPAFGATSTTPAFGATPSFGAASTAPAFGANTSLNFGSAAPAFGAATPAFGATTTPAFGTGLGGGLNFGTGTSTAATTGLSFGTTTKSSGLGGFGFGTTQSSLGLFGTTTSTTSSAFGNTFGSTSVTGTQLSTSAAPSLGLGGVSQTGTTNTAATDGKTEPPKQTKLPNEISTTVDSFKEFVKKQKSLSSEVMRVSIKPLHQVAREVESTLRSVLSLRGECVRARSHSMRLRASAAAALAAAESAAREPPGLEFEGAVPPTYVRDLIAELEQQLITFRRQMDEADKQMQSSPKLLSEQELTMGIRRMHESLVALAGTLQAAHTQVEEQKQLYLNMRKQVLKDNTNVFDTPQTNGSLDQILRDAEGTRKKTKPANFTDISLSSAVVSDPRTALGNIQQLAGPTPFTYLGSTLSSFPASDISGSNWTTQPQPTLPTNISFGSTKQNESFQLQKPPGKRGKQ